MAARHHPLARRAGTCLHAWRLSFDDLAGQRITVQAVPEPDFWAPVATELSAAERIALLRP